MFCVSHNQGGLGNTRERSWYVCVLISSAQLSICTQPQLRNQQTKEETVVLHPAGPTTSIFHRVLMLSCCDMHGEIRPA